MAINRRTQRKGDVHLVAQQFFDLRNGLSGLADCGVDFKLPTGGGMNSLMVEYGLLPHPDMLAQRLQRHVRIPVPSMAIEFAHLRRVHGRRCSSCSLDTPKRARIYKIRIIGGIIFLSRTVNPRSNQCKTGLLQSSYPAAETGSCRAR